LFLLQGCLRKKPPEWLIIYCLLCPLPSRIEVSVLQLAWGQRVSAYMKTPSQLSRGAQSISGFWTFQNEELGVPGGGKEWYQPALGTVSPFISKQEESMRKLVLLPFHTCPIYQGPPFYTNAFPRPSALLL
jgi:hypothetical protein